jgi:hypothetical protein
MDRSRPEHARDRATRQAGRRRRQRKWRAAKASAGLALVAGALSAPTWVGPYLRRAGIHLPSIPHPLQLAVLVVAVIFVAGQVMLLIFAISAGSKESQERYLELMHHWPYVLMAPVVILKRRALPDRYFGGGGQHRSDRHEKGEGDEGNSPSTPPVTPEQYRRALRVAIGQVPDADTSPLTLQQYRRALRLAMDQLSSVTMDRDLQELLMRQLESLEQHTPRQSEK